MISLMTTIVIVVFQVTIGTVMVWAGPPFTTDDPETVGYRHWEIDVASQSSKDKEETSGTAPHVEINYGLWPNVDLHMIVLFSYVSPKEGSTNYGFGDIELGVKYRFVQEKEENQGSAISFRGRTAGLVADETGRGRQGFLMEEQKGDLP